jgi:hypothetical protein
MSAPAKNVLIAPVLVADMNKSHFSIPLSVKQDDKTIELKALVDSGASGMFFDRKFVQKHNLQQKRLEKPIRVRNVDGSNNDNGMITHCVWMNVTLDNRNVDLRFHVSGLGHEEMILGLPWLKRFNPKVDWEKGTVEIDEDKFKNTFLTSFRKGLDVKLIEEKMETPTRQSQENPAPHNDQNTWEEAMVGAIKAEIEEGEEIDEQ